MDDSTKTKIKLIEICDDYGIPFTFLPDIILEPKVIPMIRGYSFEYVVYSELSSLLKDSDYLVKKDVTNPQINFADKDVEVYNKKTKTSFVFECKLSGKGSYLKSKNRCRIKCMRSRTLGEEAAKTVSKHTKLPVSLILNHKDNYHYLHFDFVVTNLANVFYKTRDDGIFEFNPDKEEFKVLREWTGENQISKIKAKLQKTLYFAKSKDIAPLQENDNLCTKKNCTLPNECGFIPNYPYFDFEKIEPWKELTKDNLTKFI